MSSTREKWIDYVKVIACIFVALGHFYQSMIMAGIVPNTIIYKWFTYLVYSFHVPLFFICSGYLYQRRSEVRTKSQWTTNVIRKLIVLGIPYFEFSYLTWGMKSLFSSTVNRQAGSILRVLFVEPQSPYWYLYMLWIFFVVTMTMDHKKKMVILLMISIVCKLLLIVLQTTNIYVLDKILENWFWFVGGMTLNFIGVDFKNIKRISFSIMAFLILSVVVLRFHRTYGIVYVMGLLACYSVIGFVQMNEEKLNNKLWNTLAQNTMPIFLMHTIFAAFFRILLIKFGINNPVVHIVAGLAISFLGPMAAMYILNRFKPLDFIVYPGKYIKR